MSWGKGIAVALTLFIAMIMTLVYKSTQQHFSLVTEDYYEESLVYDQVQSRISNYTRLGAPVEVRVDNAAGSVTIDLPAQFEGRSVRGEIHMYNPVDSRYDVRVDLGESGTVDTRTLKKGKWNVIVDWEADGTAYRFERTVFLN